MPYQQKFKIIISFASAGGFCLKNGADANSFKAADVCAGQDSQTGYQAQSKCLAGYKRAIMIAITITNVFDINKK